MFIADLLLAESGSDVDRPIEGFLHLGCEFIGFHKSGISLFPARWVQLDPLAKEGGNVEVLTLHDGRFTLIETTPLIGVERKCSLHLL